MKSLIIDTASQNLYVALLTDESKKEIHLEGKNHSVMLMKVIREVLPVFDADEVIVGIGPGSYTGVRVGVVVAKTIAWSKQIPLKTVSSLYIQASGYNQRLVSMIDARRGNCFSCVIDNDEIVTPELLRANNEILESFVVTEFDFLADPYKIRNKAVTIDNIHGLVPNYLRLTEVERNEIQNNGV